MVNAKGLVVKKQTTKLKLLLFVFVSNLSNRLKRWLRIMFRSVLKVTHNGHCLPLLALITNTLRTDE